MEQPVFTVDLVHITPDDVIKNIAQEGIEKILGAYKAILYIGIKNVVLYSVDEWSVFVWNDQRGRENMIFISGVQKTQNQSIIHWYLDKRIATIATRQIGTHRDFIEQCVLWKNITPANLSQ